MKKLIGKICMTAAVATVCSTACCVNMDVGAIKNKVNFSGISFNAPLNWNLQNLIQAIVSRDAEKVENILSNNTNPLLIDLREINGFAPLHIAVISGRKDIVSILLKNHADPDIYSVEYITPLYIASVSGNVDIVDLLVNEGKADINKRCEYRGETPLYAAIKNGESRAAMELIKLGAMPIVCSKSGETALHIAASVGDMDLVKILTEDLKLSPTLKDRNRMSAFCHAVMNGKTDVVEYLLSMGCDPNTKSPSYAPMLIVATFDNNVNMVKTLLKDSRTLINAEWLNHGNAMDIALRSGNKEMIETLSRAGAK